MKLRHLLDRLGIPEEGAIIVLGMTIPARCGYCHRRFGDDEIVLVSPERQCGYHVQCQAKLDRQTMN